MKTMEGNATWTEEKIHAFYENLLNRALECIPESGAVLVLGPMFILRSPEENFALFEKAQSELRDKGLEVFNQLPFVDYNLENAPFDYTTKFEVFYKPIIQSGKITACYLLPGWKNSQGTISEIEYAKEAGVPVYEM